MVLELRTNVGYRSFEELWASSDWGTRESGDYHKRMIG